MGIYRDAFLRHAHSGRVMFIMRGLPGSGKSTLANLIKEWVSPLGDALICSADKFFMNDGVYTFHAPSLSIAHNMCFSEALAYTSQEVPIVIVDNTNLSRAEYTPYVMLGKARYYDVKLVLANAPMPICRERQIHGVSHERYEHMKLEPRAPFDPDKIVVSTETMDSLN